MDGQSFIRGKREAAEHARRLAKVFKREEDQRRALAYAAELEAEADALERSDGLTAPPSQSPR